ncbi:nucleotidyltransferase family protein [Candidatus Omnitrophota bacterium]
MNNALKEIDCIILCGGLGKRLKDVVGDRPKALAQINQKPFLDILIDYLMSFDCNRVILCIGHSGDVIKAYYQQKKMSAEVIFSQEQELLGTGGALKNAQGLIQSETFLVMNGDSFCAVDLNALLDFHAKKDAVLSMVLAELDSSSDYGNVTVVDDARIKAFQEKPSSSRSSLMNAGVYCMRRDIFSHMPDQSSFSLERDVFPQMLSAPCYGFVTTASCIDIGTPERYKEAQKILAKESLSS